jgi:hypothetical protein
LVEVQLNEERSTLEERGDEAVALRYYPNKWDQLSVQDASIKVKEFIVAYRPVTRQQWRDKQLYNSRC